MCCQAARPAARSGHACADSWRCLAISSAALATTCQICDGFLPSCIPRPPRQVDTERTVRELKAGIQRHMGIPEGAQQLVTFANQLVRDTTDRHET